MRTSANDPTATLAGLSTAVQQSPVVPRCAIFSVRRMGEGWAVNRRSFIALIGGAVVWPAVTRAQQSERMRHIGVLMFLAEDDPGSKARIATFIESLQQLGWTIGRNVQIDIRWSAADPVRSRKYAVELAATAPDVILATASESTAALREATRTLPIVFTGVTDPVGAGYVASLARPGGNATGFTFVEYGMSGKWLELLKEIAPRVTRAAILRDPTLPAGTGQLGAIQALAPSLGVETTPIDVRDVREIERAIADFARTPNSGLIVPTSPAAMVNRKPIITLAAQHRLPAVYFLNTFAKDGGLISYGPDAFAQYRQAAGYVDRILKGEKPADLPVQAPTKYELVINLKTAKALGLTAPPALLGRADEVIE
jgi:putative tryptophan/tyrosine transport system substrate-binding protein